MLHEAKQLRGITGDDIAFGLPFNDRKHPSAPLLSHRKIKFYMKQDLFYAFFLSYKKEESSLVSMSNSNPPFRTSEEPVWTILDYSILGIALIQDNTLKYLNKRFAEIFGYSITEMREWPLEGFVILVHPEEKEFMREHWRKIHRGNINGSITYPIRGITKSGATIWLEVFLNQILLEGKPAVLMQVMDISEKKANELLIEKLGSDLAVQNERLEQINEERDEYLEIIAHELRTPLTSILGFCEFFRNESSCLTPSQMQYLEVITRNAQRLNRLVAHILGKSQLNHSKMELTLETNPSGV